MDDCTVLLLFSVFLSDIYTVTFSYVGIMDDAILLNIFYTYGVGA